MTHRGERSDGMWHRGERSDGMWHRGERSDRMSHGRPTAAELVAAVAEFLEGEVREQTTGSVNFHARVAANVLRTVERELLDDAAGPDLLGFPDEAALSAAIRRGEFDDRKAELVPTLRALVEYRLAVAHPGYERE